MTGSQPKTSLPSGTPKTLTERLDDDKDTAEIVVRIRLTGATLLTQPLALLGGGRDLDQGGTSFGALAWGRLARASVVMSPCFDAPLELRRVSTLHHHRPPLMPTQSMYGNVPQQQQQPQAAQQDLSVVLVTGSYDHEIRFWEAWSGICSRTIARSGEQGQVNRIAISPDKRLLAAAIHKKIAVYEVAGNANTPIVVFEGHTGNVTAVCFHAEGKWVVTGSEDSTIRIWDLRSSHLYRSYDNGSPVNDVVIHPNQGELISCDQSGAIKQWDLSENSCTLELTPMGEIPMRSISVASDGSLLVAGNNKGKVFIWRICDDPSQDRFQPVSKFQAHNRYLTRCLLSPDVKLLATCSADKTIKIWSIASNYDVKLEKSLVGHQRWVWDCAFSADSAYLVTASSDHVARLWELSSGETVRQYNGHRKAAVCVALNDVNLA